MLAGITHVNGRGLWARLQTADWALLKGVAAGMSAAGFTLTAMGNNMAIRRSAYQDVGGYPSIPPSVTEDYALSRRLAGIGRIAPHAHPPRHNITAPGPAPNAMFQQQPPCARGVRSHPPR